MSEQLNFSLTVEPLDVLVEPEEELPDDELPDDEEAPDDEPPELEEVESSSEQASRSSAAAVKTNAADRFMSSTVSAFASREKYLALP